MHKRIISDVMTPYEGYKTIISLKKTVEDALEQMKSSGMKNILVVNDDDIPIKTLKLIDIVGKNPDTHIEDLHLEPVVKLQESNSIDDKVKDELSKDKVIIAMNGEHPSGILTATDLARYWKYRIHEM